MTLLAGLLLFLTTGFLASVMAFYVDHRAGRRMRSGALPPTIPRLMMPFVWVIDPVYLYSPLFSRAQDRSTQWLVTPLRLCMAVATISLGVCVVLLVA